MVGEATEAMHLQLTDREFGNAPVDLPMSILFGKAPRMHREITRQPLQHPPLALQLDVAAATELLLQVPASEPLLRTCLRTEARKSCLLTSTAIQGRRRPSY